MTQEGSGVPLGMALLGSDKDASQILEIANQLIDEFKIHDFRPRSVSWVEYMIRGRGIFTGPRVRSIPIGWCEFTWDEVILPDALKGKLEPEEWKPLLASSLVYAVKVRRKKVAGIVARIAIPVLLESVAFAILFPIWPVQLSGALLAIIFGTIVLLMMGIPLVNAFLKSLRLQSDKLAADRVGKESLLRVLAKISSMQLENVDIEGRLTMRPSLAERIRILEA